MIINEFKIVKNRQRPELCYAYEKYNKDRTKKYSLFTMDGGKTFLVSITSTNASGKLVDTDFVKVASLEKGIDELNKQEKA